MEQVVKKMIIAVFIIIIIILLIIVGIVVSNKYHQKNNLEIIDDEGNYSEQHDEENTESVSITESDFYTVTNCVSQYFDIINTNNPAYMGKDDNGNFVKVISDSEIKAEIYDILSTEYINKNNISKNNVYNFVDNIKEELIFVPIDMKQKITNTPVQEFMVSGLLEDQEYKIKKVKYLIVNLDTANKTFSVEPLEDNKYNNLDEIIIENDISEIQVNDNNEFSYQMITSEDVAQKYIDTFKKIILGNAKLGYQLLDEEYKNQRFEDEENFEKYVQKNYNELISIRCVKYLVNNYDNYKEYICQDQYNNFYIFTVNNTSEYTVKMDTYTLITDNFKNTYDSANDQNKILMNVDKWVKMLNSRDYKNAYKYLDETFRQNNFKTEDDFENYMRQNYSSHYEIEFLNNSEENKVFIQEIRLKDIDNETNNKDFKIIMQLKENYDFVMSFEI